MMRGYLCDFREFTIALWAVNQRHPKVANEVFGSTTGYKRYGGARSLALTFLRPDSLLTGKITGNSRFLALEFALPSLQAAHFAGENLHSPQIGTGN